MKIQNTRVAIFQGEALPGESRLVALAALANALNLRAPVRIPACVSDKHISGSVRTEGPWKVYDKRYWPGDTFDDHLDFALRNETGSIFHGDEGKWFRAWSAWEAVAKPLIEKAASSNPKETPTHQRRLLRYCDTRHDVKL